MQAHLLLLLILSDDVEMNPGPNTMSVQTCQDCKKEKGSLRQGYLMLCSPCNDIRFPIGISSDTDTSSKSFGSKRKGKNQGNGRAKHAKKEIKQLQATNQTTGIDRVMELYSIKTDLRIPLESLANC